MARKIQEPRELFTHELGHVLTLAQAIVETTPEVRDAVKDEELRQHAERHLEQAKGGLQRVEQAFQQLGAEPEPERSPLVEGLRREHDQLVKRLAEELRDGYEAATSVKTHHTAVAHYTALVASARALGERDVAGLLEQNLAEERGAPRRGREARAAPGEGRGEGRRGVAPT